MSTNFDNIESVDLAGNPALKEFVAKDTELKEWLVNYVGDKTTPEDGNVTVEMIIEAMSEDFPEFLMAIAEENFIRGYQQAFMDLAASEKSRE